MIQYKLVPHPKNDREWLIISDEQIMLNRENLKEGEPYLEHTGVNILSIK
jgi:hypothetical protein